MYCLQTFLENLYHYKEGVSVQVVVFTPSKNLFPIPSILIVDDNTLMYDNYVIIQTVFVQFDLPKADNTSYCRNYRAELLPITSSSLVYIGLQLLTGAQK